MEERLDEDARLALAAARAVARTTGKGLVGTEHLLIGVLADAGCREVIASMGVEAGRLLKEVQARRDEDGEPIEELLPRARRALELSHAEADEFRAERVGAPHLLLALSREGDGAAGRALAFLGFDLENARLAVQAVRASTAEARIPEGGRGTMWDRFTARAKGAVQRAQASAIRLNHDEVDPEHLLLGLLDDPGSVAARVLAARGVDPAAVRAEVEKGLPRGEREDSDFVRVVSAEGKATVMLAYEAARDLDNSYIGTEHLLLALIRQPDRLAGRALARAGAGIETAREAAKAVQDADRRRNLPPPAKVEGSGMWQRFTERARKVVFYAQEEAQKFGEGYVSTEHLLLGLAREPDSVAARVLEKLGISLNRIRVEVEKQLPRGDSRPSQDMTLTPRAKRVIDLSYDEARNLNNNYIGTEHLLLGLIREGDGLAGRVLCKLGAELERARREVMAMQDQEMAAAGGQPRPHPATPPPADPWERFEPEAREATIAAEGEALRRGQSFRSPEHLLLAILARGESRAVRALAALGVDIARLRRAVVRRCRKGPAREGEAPLSPASVNAFTLAYKEQSMLGAGKTGTEHLLLGLLREPDGVAGRTLEEFGISLASLREAARGLGEP